MGTMTIYSIADDKDILHGFGLWKTFNDAKEVLTVLKRYADPLNEFYVKAIDSLTGLEVKEVTNTQVNGEQAD